LRARSCSTISTRSFRSATAFLRFNEYEILTHAGKVSAEVAKKLAEDQYTAFRVRQDEAFESDFEREIQRTGGGLKGGNEGD